MSTLPEVAAALLEGGNTAGVVEIGLGEGVTLNAGAVVKGAGVVLRAAGLGEA